MKEIDIKALSEDEIKAAFKEAYNSAPAPLQVSPRTPATAHVANCDEQGKAWRKHAYEAGFRYVVYRGTSDAYVYSLQPQGATYYNLSSYV